jgi:hypothetical protein
MTAFTAVERNQADATALQNATRIALRAVCPSGVPQCAASCRGRYARFAAGLLLLCGVWIEAAGQSLDDGLRWTIDLSSRVQHLTEDAPSQTGYFNSVGIDARQVISDGTRDLVRLNLQMNLWCIHGLTRRPGLFDDEDDCKVVNKVSTAEFAVSGDGKFNIIVGHPEVPYGLEVPVSTSQTVR